MTPAPPLVTVRLLDFPLKVYRRTQEHYDGLFREFALFAIDPPASLPGHEVPRRLLQLVDEVQTRFAGVTQAPNEQRDRALDAGLDRVDLTYLVPPEAREASLSLEAMLEEADEFCRAGDLLTLASPPEVRRFRHWYLGQFVAQVDGAAPTPWTAAG